MTGPVTPPVKPASSLDQNSRSRPSGFRHARGWLCLGVRSEGWALTPHPGGLTLTAQLNVEGLHTESAFDVHCLLTIRCSPFSSSSATTPEVTSSNFHRDWPTDGGHIKHGLQTPVQVIAAFRPAYQLKLSSVRPPVEAVAVPEDVDACWTEITPSSMGTKKGSDPLELPLGTMKFQSGSPC